MASAGSILIFIGRLRTGDSCNNATEDLVPVRFVPLIGEDGWGSGFRLTMRKSVPQ